MNCGLNIASSSICISIVSHNITILPVQPKWLDDSPQETPNKKPSPRHQSRHYWAKRVVRRLGAFEVYILAPDGARKLWPSPSVMMIIDVYAVSQLNDWVLLQYVLTI